MGSKQFVSLEFVADALWGCTTPVMKLPCICKTPSLHSEECSLIRSVAFSVLSWEERMTARTKLEDEQKKER